MSDPHLLPEIKWRGSSYRLVEVKDGKVHWFNPVSRHTASCAVEAWMKSDPYDYASK